MTSSATIYNPASEELSDRVRAFKSVFVAYEQINAAGASELFGESQDIADAKKIITHSMKQACQNLSARDLNAAEDIGLLTDEQLRDFSILKQQLEFEALKQDQDGQSQSSGQKP